MHCVDFHKFTPTVTLGTVGIQGGMESLSVAERAELYDLAVRLMSAVMQHHGGEDGPAAAALLQRSASSAKPALTFAGSVTTLVRTEGGQAAKKNADVDAVSAAATAAAQSAATAQKTEKQLATLTQQVAGIAQSVAAMQKGATTGAPTGEGGGGGKTGVKRPRDPHAHLTCNGCGELGHVDRNCRR